MIEFLSESRSVRQGFVLLEALVALALITLVALAAMGVLGEEMRSARRLGDAARAQALAEDRLAIIRSATLDLSNGVPASLARGRFRSPLQAYDWALKVRDVPGERGLMVVSVQVEWEAGTNTMEARVFRIPRSDSR